MKRAAVLLLLAGCVAHSPGIRQIEAPCEHMPFQQFAACVAQGIDYTYPNWRASNQADLTGAYLAWLNAAGERVSTGEMTEAEARYGAAELQIRMNRIANERNAAASAGSVNTMLMGFALMNAANPPPSQNRPIVCNSSTLGGNVTTICH